ncbi:MAG TPA: hypothetical protein VFE37_20770 [Chloroflexota bacterium]|nr:hypothetical protein [Chloroflexota bacterium]
MALKSDVRPEELGRGLQDALAEASDVVKGLWLTAHRGAVSFWILTAPIDAATQRALYERTNVLYERFPQAEFDVHVLNPEWFAGADPLSALPRDAKRLLPAT